MNSTQFKGLIKFKQEKQREKRGSREEEKRGERGRKEHFEIQFCRNRNRETG